MDCESSSNSDRAPTSRPDSQTQLLGIHPFGVRSAISGLSHASFVRRSSLKGTLECSVAPHLTRSLRWSRRWQPSWTTVAHHNRGLDNTQGWNGELYPPEQFRG